MDKKRFSHLSVDGPSLSILGAKVAVLSTATARVVYTLAVREMWIRGTRTGVARSRG